LRFLEYIDIILLNYFFEEDKMSKRKKLIILSLILLIISIAYTVLVKTVDVKAIGPNNTSVGFASLNEPVHNALGYNETFYKISKYLGILAFGFIGLYFLIGLIQLVKEKSVFKVDREIIGVGVFYIVFLIVYVLFEKIALNYRPVLMDGELEASFPSTHTLLALCICGSAIMVNGKVIKNDLLRKLLNIAAGLIMLGIVVTRVMSGVHWASDIIGGVIISLFLLTALKAFLAEERVEKH